jgi:pilus assembly protein FimV
MVAKFFGRALALLLLCPTAAFALGLGDIHLLSSLNAPLDAEIELVGATPEDLVSLHASVASHDTFTHYGLDWPAFLSGVTMRPAHTADGRMVIKLASRESITEPFITLLVEVNWARGQLVREYTVLLDPPVYTPGQSQATAAPVQAPAVATATREGSISRPSAPAVAASNGASASTSGSAPASASSERTSAPAGEAGTHLVRRGDTLSQIAGALSAGGAVRTRSWMVAIYTANPSAFESNMNLLHAGAVLRIPDASTAAAVTPTDALTEIRRQYASWRGAAPARAASTAESGRLHLITPDESAQPGAHPGSSTSPSPGSSASPNGAPGGADARVRELEAQLQESRRLLEMRNAELAKLQAQIGARGAATPAPGPQVAPPSATAPTPVTPPPAAAVSEAAPPIEQPTAPPAAQPAPPPAVRPVHVTSNRSEQSLFTKLLHFWWIAALIIVLLLARAGLTAWRSRQEVKFDDSLGRLATAGADTVSREALGDTASMRATRDSAFVVEESASHDRPRSGAPSPVVAAATRTVATDDTMSSDTAINLDQGDPLAEADFHMAYGLYDQAADLVRIAISREPTRRDLKLKLLEVFFVWGNKEQFLHSAQELATTRAQAAPGEWEKIVIMGKQLAPEDPLFSSGAGVSGAAAGGVDLDLEGGQSRIDFDLLGEPVPEGAAAGLDLDIGSPLGETDRTTESPTTRATDAALALHGLEFGSEASAATTRQTTAHVEPVGDDSTELPTVEQPGLEHSDTPTIRQKVEMALRQSGGGEQTEELALDDLGLDLGSLETGDQTILSPPPETPTLVAGLDERSQRAMHEAERRAATTGAGSSATGAWRVKPEDLDPTLPPVAPNEFDHGTPVDDASDTSRMAALKAHDLDFDLSDIGGDAPAANGQGEVDLDVGPALTADTAFAATQKLSAEDLALPDLEPATMSEVGTKLDLARAYMDMGDPEGARNILEEVLHEGSVAQKQEAQRLLQSLPG